MFRADVLKAGYLHVNGWRQDYDPVNMIAQTLNESESGQFYQDLHPLLTLENLRAIAPDFSQITYDGWVVTQQYRVGDRVSFSGEDYRAKADSLGVEPDNNPDEWEDFDPFSEWLEDKTMASNMNAMQSIYAEKIRDKTAKNILEQKTLFDGAGNLSDVIENGSNLVGVEIVPIRSKGATVKIEKIGLQFIGTGEVTLFLMHSSSTDPIKTITAQVQNGRMKWNTQSSLYLPYESEETDAGGSWFLCYDQAALADGLKAINKNRDWSKAPCSTCSTYDTTSYLAWSKYLEIHPFKVSDYSDPVEMWDIDSNVYTYDMNYGINIQLSVECDVTDLLISNRLSFQTVLGHQMAADMIAEFAYNPSYNITRQTQAFSKNELLYELNGKEGDNENSVNFKLRTAIDAIKVDMGAMSRACMLCGNKGIKYRTV